MDKLLSYRGFEYQENGAFKLKTHIMNKKTVKNIQNTWKKQKKSARISFSQPEAKSLVK